jgi:hemerythrin-like domain-containing protein
MFQLIVHITHATIAVPLIFLGYPGMDTGGSDINHKSLCSTGEDFVTPGHVLLRYTLTMPVQIGATTHAFDDPTGLLSDCHRRVEMFMGSLQAVAAISTQSLTDETRRSLDLALRYFREAAPKHTSDEEESLFPRLRQIQSTEMKAALAQMDALEQDHRWAEPLHALVETIGMRYLEAGVLSSADAQEFREAVEQLAAMYKRHIEIEDSRVFPVAARLLPKDAKDEIAQEMAARRNVKTIELK